MTPVPSEPRGVGGTRPADAPWPARLPGLDVEAGIASASGNRRLYRRLLGKFTAQYAAAPETLRRWLDAGRVEEARQLAHTIKGAAATLGANDLHPAVRALETAETYSTGVRAPFRVVDLVAESTA